MYWKKMGRFWYSIVSKVSDVPGVDFLLPDFSYLEKRSKDILGLFFKSRA